MIGIEMALLRKRIVAGAKAQGRKFALPGQDPEKRGNRCCALQAISGRTGQWSGLPEAAGILGITFGQASAIEDGFEGWAGDSKKQYPYHYALGRSLRKEGK